MMDFPDYVPAAVRKHISARIDGDSRESFGLAAALASAERQLVKIEQKLNDRMNSGDLGLLDGLRQQKAQAIQHRDWLASDVSCLQRLARDLRMAEVFTILTDQFTDDQQWRNFILSAWAAKIDHSKYREKLKRATELTGEISKASQGLAQLLRQFSETGINAPDAFYSIPELLRTTDNTDMNGHNLEMWRAMRQHVLGDRKAYDNTEEEKVRDTQRYIWGLAPDFSALLDTVANEARHFKPSESGMIGAAVATRQHSAKTEYLRALGHRLTDTYRFTLSPDILKAVAIVANVVIDDAEIDVSYDDVRKAIKT